MPLRRKLNGWRLPLGDLYPVERVIVFWGGFSTLRTSLPANRLNSLSESCCTASWHQTDQARMVRYACCHLLFTPLIRRKRCANALQLFLGSQLHPPSFDTWLTLTCLPSKKTELSVCVFVSTMSHPFLPPSFFAHSIHLPLILSTCPCALFCDLLPLFLPLRSVPPLFPLLPLSLSSPPSSPPPSCPPPVKGSRQRETEGEQHCLLSSWAQHTHKALCVYVQGMHTRVLSMCRCVTKIMWILCVAVVVYSREGVCMCAPCRRSHYLSHCLSSSYSWSPADCRLPLSLSIHSPIISHTHILTHAHTPVQSS